MRGKISALPRDACTIRVQTERIKSIFNLTKAKCFPILRFIELVMPLIDKDFNFQVVPKGYFKDRYAETLPSLHIIRVSESVYYGAKRGNKFHRFVLAHELGHYIMHTSTYTCYAKMKSRRYDTEWQADKFAIELLIPYRFAVKHTPGEISRICGVPFREAKNYKNAIIKEIRQVKAMGRRRKVKNRPKVGSHHS